MPAEVWAVQAMRPVGVAPCWVPLWVGKRCIEAGTWLMMGERGSQPRVPPPGSSLKRKPSETTGSHGVWGLLRGRGAGRTQGVTQRLATWLLWGAGTAPGGFVHCDGKATRPEGPRHAELCRTRPEALAISLAGTRSHAHRRASPWKQVAELG